MEFENISKHLSVTNLYFLRFCEPERFQNSQDLLHGIKLEIAKLRQMRPLIALYVILFPLLVISLDTSCLIDRKRLISAFKSGLPYVHDDWVEEEGVRGIVRQLRELQAEKGRFRPSGLSVSTNYEQDFDEEADRSICGIDILSERDMTLMSEPIMLDISKRMTALQQELSVVLDRPSLADPSLAHESYFSSSKAPAFLKRHVKTLTHSQLEHMP